jgi:hypothetical protein
VKLPLPKYASLPQIREEGVYKSRGYSDLLMEAAEWWIKTHALEHFEKAVKVREMIRGAIR